MGKLDDIRKQREAQFAQQESEAGSPARRAVAKSAPAKPTSEVLEGKCAECGKLKAVQSGLVVSHQKGLGKMCPGSRKAPD